MSAPKLCPKCQRPMDGNAPRELCPACLLETMVSPDDGAAARSAPLTERPGDRIGRYKLREKIGEGGFGIVYVAEQEEPVRRRVALKVIKLGMDTREVIARFEAERQALAMMDHPNIARVLDVGATDAGRPYFVMELVKGIRITDYCDQHNLTTSDRLELFTQVCHAIQHAHQKGVIHRDIKPSNILVTSHDGRPVPKVIDFGIAKATQGRLTDLTVYTELNQFMGTPAYMSPEQAELSGLDVDTRTDIYALGVLLYQLLTGQTPFDPKKLVESGLDEIRRTIREVEPPRPSTRLNTMLDADQTDVAKHRQTDSRKLTSLLRGDLDWIVMKALEKDRTRRYDTANGFALDIKRFLADEPVSAAAPSAAYRFGKFARRNKTAFGVAAAFAVTLVAATVASTWQAIRATRAEELAHRNVIRATAAEALARKRVIEVAAERDAKEKARQEAQAIATFLAEVFRSPDPARDGRTITVAETLARAMEKIDTDLASQPARRSALQATLGRTYYALGLPREAIPLFEKNRDYHLAVHGPEHPETLSALNNLANAFRAAGRRAEALKLRENLVALHRKVDGPAHPETLSAMANLASSYDDAGRQNEALKMLEEILALSRKVNGPEHDDTLAAMNDLALYYRDAGRRDEALKLQKELLILTRKLKGPEHPKTLGVMANLAVSYGTAGLGEDALKLNEQVLALKRKVLGPEHPDTLTTMNNLANSFRKAGRLDEAVNLGEETVALRLKVSGREHPDTLLAMANLANSYDDAGRRAEALKMEDEVLTLKRKVLGPEHPDTLWAMNNLAVSYADAGRRDEAIKMLEELLPLRIKVNGPEDRNTLRVMRSLARCYRDAGRRDEAIKLEEQLTKTGARSAESQPQGVGDTTPTVSRSSGSDNQDYARADSLYRKGQYAEAATLYRQILQNQLKLFPATNEMALGIAASLARDLADWAWAERDSTNKVKAYDHAVEAEHLLRDCFDVRQHGTNAASWRTADVKSRLGFAVVVLAVTDGKITAEARAARFAEAEPLLVQSAEALQTESRVSPTYKRDSLERLLRLYEAWEKPEKLAEWKQKLDAFDKAQGETRSTERTGAK